MERKDLKGRILRTGESQRKDGRYMYKYVDINGDSKYVYSWKLVRTDKIPAGKSYCPSLRELEEHIKADLHDNIDIDASKETLNERFAKYMAQKNIEDTTRTNYCDSYRLHAEVQLGNRPIRQIRYSDIKNRYIEMLTKEELSGHSVCALQTVLFPIFRIAVRDNIIRANPAVGIIEELKEEFEDEFYSEGRKALTISEQKTLLEFVKNDPVFCQWYPVIVAFIGTGMRSEELLALRWEDVDFERKQISVNHKVVYRGITDEKSGGKHKCSFIASSKMKNKYSKRIIPLSDKVAEALEIQREYNKIKPCRAKIGEYSNFIFSSRYPDRILKGKNVNDALGRIEEAYNKKEEERAKEEGRMPVYMPHVTCHIFRHTFATRLREKNINRDVIQALMGHKEGGETLDIYAEMQRDRIMQELDTLDDNLMLNI